MFHDVAMLVLNYVGYVVMRNLRSSVGGNFISF